MQWRNSTLHDRDYDESALNRLGAGAGFDQLKCTVTVITKK